MFVAVRGDVASTQNQRIREQGPSGARAVHEVGERGAEQGRDTHDIRHEVQPLKQVHTAVVEVGVGELVEHVDLGVEVDQLDFDVHVLLEVSAHGAGAERDVGGKAVVVLAVLLHERAGVVRRVHERFESDVHGHHKKHLFHRSSLLGQ